MNFLGYASAGLLVLGIFMIIISMIWTFISHNPKSANGIGLLTNISVLLMANGCLIAYTIVHLPSIPLLIIAIVMTEVLSILLGYFVNHVMQALNKPNALEK